MTQKPNIVPIPAEYENRYKPMTKRSQTGRIMLHCTATREGQDLDFEWLWGVHVDSNGWSGPGYHYMIELDGTIQETRPLEYQGAGCSGQNHDTIHISYVGGLDTDGRSKDTRTQAQTKSMIDLCYWLFSVYPALDNRRDVVGHNQFAAKDCPCFNVPDWVDSVIDGAEGPGDPEPEMPEVENLVQYIQDLEARIAKLEAHNDAWRE